MSNKWDRFSLNAGARLADYVTPVLDKINQTLEEADAKARAVSGESSKVTSENKEDWIKRWEELNPKPKGIMAGYGRQHLAQRAYEEALIKKGRGEYKSIFEAFDRKKSREAMLDHYINRVELHPGRGPSTITKGRPSMNVRAGQIPVPIPRPQPDDPNALFDDGRDAQGRYPNRSFRSEDMRPYQREWKYEGRIFGTSRTAPLIAIPPQSDFQNPYKGPQPVPIPRPDPNAPSEEALQSPGSYPNRSYRDPSIREYTPSTDTRMSQKRYAREQLMNAPLAQLGMDGMQMAQPGMVGPQPVTLTGPVTTQPSGVQKVEVTNMQRPNVTINLTVPVQQVMEDPRGAARRLGYEVRDAILGSQADTGN